MVKKPANMKNQNIKPYKDEKTPMAAVGAFILNSKKQILLVKSYKWGDYYCIPGGRIHIGEKMEDTVIRETKEEVGLDVEVIKFLCPANAIFPKEFFKKKHFVFLDFLCKVIGSETPKLDNREIQSYEWVNLKESLSKNLEPFGRKTIEEYIIPYLKIL